MHYLVKLLVEAETAEDALMQAESDCDVMVEHGYADWYDFNGRWGKSKAYKITTKKGKELLEEGMKCNRSEFDRGMEAIRYMMKHHTDEEIYNEDFTKTEQDKSGFYLSRYQFTIAAGRADGAVVYAMDGDLWGGRVENDKDLEHILEDKTRKLWVVPVDVHN